MDFIRKMVTKIKSDMTPIAAKALCKMIISKEELSSEEKFELYKDYKKWEISHEKS